MRPKSLLVAPLAALAALILAACGASPASAPTTAPAAGAATPMPETMPGMDHGAMAGDAPYDAAFIDSMIVHHEAAITMAKQALEQAERQEIKDLAQDIITAQEGEIAQMRQWLQEWYGSSQ